MKRREDKKSTSLQVRKKTNISRGGSITGSTWSRPPLRPTKLSPNRQRGPLGGLKARAASKATRGGRTSSDPANKENIGLASETSLLTRQSATQPHSLHVASMAGGYAIYHQICRRYFPLAIALLQVFSFPNAGHNSLQQKGKQPVKAAVKLADKIAHINHQPQLQPVRGEDDWSAAMENELQDLTGQFDQLKRDSIRPVLQDVNLAAQNKIQAHVDDQVTENTDCLPQSVTRQILQPSKAAPTIADRLQALRKGTHTVETELQSVASQVLSRHQILS